MAKFIVMTKITGLIWCTDNAFRPSAMVGPNQWSPRVWKTRRAAERFIEKFGRQHCEAIELDQYGAPRL